MKIEYGRNSLSSFERGQENCYLLTNGLGGYSSLTVIGSETRNDHALFMASLKAPNYRYHMISRVDEVIQSKGKESVLSSQQFVSYTENQEGFWNLDHFCMEYMPVWVYRIPGIEVIKTLVMPQDENTIGISYRITNRTGKTAVLEVTPWMQFVEKGEKCGADKEFITEDDCISDGSLTLFYKTDGQTEVFDAEYKDGLYYSYDARDGREPVGAAYRNHVIRFQIPEYGTVMKEIIYFMDPKSEKEKKAVSCMDLIEAEIQRQKMLELTAGFCDETAAMISKNCNQYIVRRESVNGKSMIAGYPFFADWGRDTMIALTGCCIAAGQLEDAQNILRTFMKYRHNGLMPNVFPEGENGPAYNTVDASLLFIGSVYEFYQASKDRDFVEKEAFPVICEILQYYQGGTDYHIKMDEDGLIMAGDNLEQVTWMDVRFQGILPTPRHGKPVEINAEWYNALKIAAYFGAILEKDISSYTALAERVKHSFQQLFWMEEKGFLRDVISGTKADEQLRCNQIWAVSQPFSILDDEKEKQVVDKVYEYLYTPYGLRTLNAEDEEFCAEYSGTLKKRDLSYHQGTVWTFPLGAYYLAYLKVWKYSEEAKQVVRRQLDPIREMLKEGCAGHLAEIYDGLHPNFSRGCFAQAWSMGEILRVYRILEEK